MKRGTPDHPKTHALAEGLGVELYGAVGLLEMLWHFAGRYAPTGSLGKFSDLQIARQLAWEKDPKLLKVTLISCGWLCKAPPPNHLLIHDWKDHAEDTVRKFLNRHTLEIVDCRIVSRHISTLSGRVSTKGRLVTPAVAVAVAVAVANANASAKEQNMSTSSTAQVFEHWRRVMEKPKARLDAKRSKVITARLADGYDVETLCRAIDGCRRSLWHQGVNDRNKKFDDIELICRDSKHVEAFLEIAANGEPPPMSRTTQHNARALGLLDPQAPTRAALPEETEASNDSSAKAQGRPVGPR
jgi:hypothetical protein